MKWLTGRNVTFRKDSPALPASPFLLGKQYLSLHVRVIDVAECLCMNQSISFIDTTPEPGFLPEIERVHIAWQRKLRIDVDLKESPGNDQ